MLRESEHLLSIPWGWTENLSGSDEELRATSGAMGMSDQGPTGNEREQDRADSVMIFRCISHLLLFLWKSQVSGFILKPLAGVWQ